MINELNKKEWWKNLDLTWKRIFKLSIDINHTPTNEELDQILNLESIDCSNSYILSLEPLQNLRRLRKLNCSKTRIRTLDKIQHLVLIDELDCSSTDISTLEPIRYLKDLWLLNCSNTKIQSLRGIETLSQLAYLHCSETEIENLEPLGSLEKLRLINCDNTQISDLDLIKKLGGKLEINYRNTPAQETENNFHVTDLNDRDALFEEAARLIVMQQQGSTSLIQRKLKLGYNRSGRLIDQLEAAGIVGAFEGSKAREVLVKDEKGLELLFDALRRGHPQNDESLEYEQTEIEDAEHGKSTRGIGVFFKKIPRHTISVALILSLLIVISYFVNRCSKNSELNDVDKTNQHIRQEKVDEYNQRKRNEALAKKEKETSRLKNTQTDKIVSNTDSDIYLKKYSGAYTIEVKGYYLDDDAEALALAPNGQCTWIWLRKNSNGKTETQKKYGHWTAEEKLIRTVIAGQSGDIVEDYRLDKGVFRNGDRYLKRTKDN